MKTYSWLDTTEYPFNHNYFDTGNAQMHYIDKGQGEPVVFVHGTPSWSFDYRKVIKELSKNYRCLATDHIGFGLSDKPTDYNYTVKQHAQNFENWLTSLHLENITLVVHDFGGPIGLSYAIKYPHKIKRLVILNTWMWDTSDHPAFKKMAAILKSPLLPFLYKYLNFSARFLLPGSMGNKKEFTRHIHQQYLKPLSSPAERMSTIGFAKALINEQDFFDGLWQQSDKINTLPTLFIWGMKDKFITPDYLETFKAAFPNHIVLELQQAGHFPQEEAAAEVTEAVLKFMKNSVLTHPKV